MRIYGFEREADLAIKGTTDATGASFSGSFLRSPLDLLVMTTDATGASFYNGYLRAPNGALVVAEAAPAYVLHGRGRTANGALAVTQSLTDVDWRGGTRMTSDRRVHVSGLVAILQPTDVANLGFWYKADVGTSSAVDNTALSAWNDQSGAASHLTQATGARQPTIQTNEINGLPVVRFDGTDDLMEAAAVSLTQPNTILVVAKNSAAASSRNLFDGIVSRQALFSNNGPISAFAGTVQSGAATWGSTAFHYISLVFNGASSVMRVDGVAQTLGGTLGAQALTGLRLGAFLADTSEWQGDVFELFGYSGDKSASLPGLEAYLRQRTGLS